MGIVDSLNRLQRAGSEHSRATQKLMDAAGEVAARIISAVPEEVELPRGYRVVLRRSNVGSANYLVHAYTGEYGETEYDYLDSERDGKYLHGDFHCWIPGQTREGVLLFAKDIAAGLLDEIAEWLEQRQAEDENLTQTLESAAE